MTSPFFPGLRPHFEPIMATDFSEYTVGVQPPDWTKVTRPADFTALVQTVAGSMSGKALALVMGPQSRTTIVWDKLPTDIADVEVLHRNRRAETGPDDATLMGPMVRGVFPTDTGADMTGYRVNFVNAADIRAIRFNAGAATSLASTPGEFVPEAEWWWTRARFVGNLIQYKYWKQGTAEPAYNDFTDATPILAGGLIGLGDSQDVDVYCDYFAASLGGPGVLPTPIPVPAGF